MKKLTALLLALIMVLAMNASALAADPASTVEDLPAIGKVTSGKEELSIKKEIAFFAPETTNINYPGISFTYTIAPATDAAGNITDKNGVTAQVRPGKDSAVTMGTDNKAVFAADTIEATPTGTLKSDEFVISVDPAAFDNAGIYRYELKETADTNLTTLGYKVATGAKQNSRYLDVYIGNKAGGGFEVKGYVLFYNADGNKTITSGDEGFKTEGFVHEGGDANYTNDNNVDKYETYEVTIKKNVTGTMGDINNVFPFNVAVSGAPSASNIEMDVIGGSGTNANITLTNGAAAESMVAGLKNGETAKITGIPVGATLTITETNNTVSTYKVTTTGLQGGGSSEQDVAANNKNTAGTVTTTNVEVKAVEFTNKLDDVSQTGVVLRFAPYALMLGAGVALFIILKVRKNKAVEED